ncbi:MAG: 4Fe-4S binding protein [Candidatus Altiarchaeota archaeon]|nr:4Fe-4S binding protein [Candidatus Altiarchaeota archaeon]
MAEKKGWKDIPIGGVLTTPGSALETKTGAWRAFRPVWNESKCIHCMQCVVFCPDMAIKADGGKRVETNFDYCKGCGVCAAICPVKCIDMKEESTFK